MNICSMSPIGVVLAAAIFTCTGCAGTPEPASVVTRAEPEVVGDADAELLAAAHRAVVALNDIADGDTEALLSMTSSSGLLVYPVFACAPNVLKRNSINAQFLDRPLTVADCHEEDKTRWPVISWADYFSGLQELPALKQTERIVLNQRYGIGFDSGTSYLVESHFSVQTHKIAIYFYLGTSEQDNRDWDEVGFVFDSSGDALKLVAIYHDYFSAT